MTKTDKADMSCARVKQYTASDVSKAERHNERKNETYENMNVIVERIPFNVHFKKPTAPTYMEQLKQMETDGMVSLRGLRKDATLFDEIVIDVNTMYFERNGGYEYAKQFYEEAYHFIEEKFGADNVISAVMHADEINVAATEELGKEVYHYHLHTMVLPVVEKEILWSKRCKDEKLRGTVKEVVNQISHSKKWKSDIPMTDEKGNPLLDIYSYVTEGTFDAYLYQLVESKQKFISQIMTSKSPVRSAEDVDEQALSYAEIKALASGNPMIKEKMDLDIEVSKLKLLKANHLSQKYALEDAISKGFPKQIAETQARITGYGADIATVKENTHPNGDGFSPLTLAGVTHADKKEAGAALLTMSQTMLSPEATQIGSYRGLTLELAFDTFAREYRLTMIGQLRHTVTLGTDVFGNLQRMDNALEGLPIKEQTCREQLSNLQTQLETAKAEVQKPFPREAELNTKTARLEELNSLLNLDHKEPEIVDAEPDEDQRPPERRRPQLER